MHVVYYLSTAILQSSFNWRPPFCLRPHLRSHRIPRTSRSFYYRAKYYTRCFVSTFFYTRNLYLHLFYTRYFIYNVSMGSIIQFSGYVIQYAQNNLATIKQLTQLKEPRTYDPGGLQCGQYSKHTICRCSSAAAFPIIVIAVLIAIVLAIGVLIAIVKTFILVLVSSLVTVTTRIL